MMSRFYKNPVNDKQMRWNSKNANNIVQMASDAQKVIQNSTVSMVRYLGEFDHNKIDGTMEGDCISEPSGDIYLWCNGKWEIIGNNTYNYNIYGGRTNGKTMKTAAVQAAKAGMTNTLDNVDLCADFHQLAMQACHKLDINNKIKLLCTSSQIMRDPAPVGVGWVDWAPFADADIECRLQNYSVLGEDINYGNVEAQLRIRKSDFEDGSYIDKEINIPANMSKKDKYILRIAYIFFQVWKYMSGKGDINTPPRFELSFTFRAH